MGMYTVRQYDHMRDVCSGNHRGNRIISGNRELTPSLSEQSVRLSILFVQKVTRSYRIYI